RPACPASSCAPVPEDWAGADWIVWIDADALVVNHDKGLEEFLRAAGPDRSLILGEDMSCASAVNTGVMLVKCCAWCLDLFDQVWACEQRLYQEPFHEQAALCGILQQEAPQHAAQADWWWSWRGGPRKKALGRHVFVVDCGAINFKQPEQAQFVVHLVDNKRSGPSKLQRAHAVLEALWVRGGVPLGPEAMSWAPPASSARAAAAHARWNRFGAAGDRARPSGWPAVLAQAKDGWAPVPRLPWDAGCGAAVTHLAKGSPFMSDEGPLPGWTVAALEQRHGEEPVHVEPMAPRR
ncbi:unnamed protein product, partial [Prorocentrum cordatum]